MAGMSALGARRLVLVAIAMFAFAAAAPELTRATSQDDGGGRAAAFSVRGFSSSDAPAVAYRTTAGSARRIVHRIRFGDALALDLVAAAALVVVAAHLRRRRPNVPTSPVLSLLPLRRRGPPALHVLG
jgi:hypothetical protein